MRLLLYCLIFIVIFTELRAQDEIKIEDIRNRYESFEYQDVIRLVDIFLYNNISIQKSDSLEVLTMKAVSHYSLNQIIGAEETFQEIIKLDYNYNLDPAKISPKVISFFNEIKSRFEQIEDVSAGKEEPEIKSIPINQEEITALQNQLYTATFTKSVLLPGWGHLHLENNTKGWLLAAASALTLGSMIYFIFDSNSKEESYLNETDPDLIASKYDQYNTSYKIRNSLIIGYTIIWLYSQLDLLYFSSELFSKKIKADIFPQLNLNNELGYRINLRISL